MHQSFKVVSDRIEQLWRSISGADFECWLCRGMVRRVKRPIDACGNERVFEPNLNGVFVFRGPVLFPPLPPSTELFTPLLERQGNAAGGYLDTVTTDEKTRGNSTFAVM